MEIGMEDESVSGDSLGWVFRPHLHTQPLSLLLSHSIPHAPLFSGAGMGKESETVRKEGYDGVCLETRRRTSLYLRSLVHTPLPSLALLSPNETGGSLTVERWGQWKGKGHLFLFIPVLRSHL